MRPGLRDSIRAASSSPKPERSRAVPRFHTSRRGLKRSTGPKGGFTGELQTSLLGRLSSPTESFSLRRLQINGQSTGLLTEINAGPRGKIVRINLRRYPGYGLIAGRNTVEIMAHNRRGREFYASFVLRTVTENRNQDFAYRVATGPDSKQQVPPELVLLEPEHEITLPPGVRAQKVRFVGVATAAGSVARVTINGESVPLKRGNQITLRGLGLVNENNRVSFDSVYAIGGDAAEVVVEATDAAGNRTRLQVPVRRREGRRRRSFPGGSTR
jgi:hypothetical protein